MTAIRESKPSVESPIESSDNTNQPTRGISLKWIWLGIVVVLAGIVLVVVSQRDTTHPEETRAKAEAVLRARFHDTNPGVGPLKSMSVAWKGDGLVATWVQGDVAQKRCTAPVLVSPDGQSFGIAAFQAVPFDKQDSAPATCVSTQGLDFGLPLGG